MWFALIMVLALIALTVLLNDDQNCIATNQGPHRQIILGAYPCPEDFKKLIALLNCRWNPQSKQKVGLGLSCELKSEDPKCLPLNCS